MFLVRNRLPSWSVKLVLLLVTVTSIIFIIDLDKLPRISEYSQEYLAIQSGYSSELSNDLKHLLTSVEKKEKYFLLIAIPSMPVHLPQRAAIRATWRNVSRWSALRQEDEHFKRIKVMFLFAKTKFGEMSDEFQQELRNNDDMYIIDGLQEGRLVLKYKVLWALTQSLSFDYDYFIKTDDDIFVNLPLMTMSLMTSPRQRFYTGSCMHAYGGFGGYPHWRYCSGGGYVLSRDVVMEIQKLPEQVHQVKFRPEDAYTGWLINRLNTLTDFKVKVFTQGLLKVGPYKCGPFTHTWFYHHVTSSKMESFFQNIDQNVYVECPDS